MDKHSFSTNKLIQIFKSARKPINWFRETRLRNKIFVVIAVLLVGFFIFRNIQSSNAQPQYITESVKRVTIVEIVSETGNVGNSGKTDIFSTSNGIVEEIYAQNGDEVQVGTELFKVNSTATEQEKATTLANYLSAASVLDTANATLYSLQSTMFSKWDKYKILAENSTYENDDGTPKNDQRTLPEFHIAEKDWLAAESNYKKQQGVISQAQAALTAANLAYQATQNSVVKSTAQGKIANLSIEIGDKVSATSLVTGPAPTTPALSIVSELSNSSVKLSLNEVDISKVRTGQKASINLDAFADKTFDGKVTKVDEIGTNALGVVTYNVYVTILNFDNRIKPAMTANVDIEVDQAENVLTVPNSAIKPYKGGKAVQIYDVQSKEPKFIPIKIGVRGIDKTEVLEGVAEGVEVITALQNGQVKRSGSTILGGGQ